MAHRSHGVRSHWRTREPVKHPTFIDQYRDVAKMRNDAIDAGDEQLVIAMDRLLAKLDDEAAEQKKRSTMPTQTEIIKTLRDGLRANKMARLGVEERLSTGEINAQFAQNEKNRLRREAVALEQSSRQAFAAWAIETSSEANAKRAEAEAQRDPAVRVADELERARLVASPQDSAMLASQALWMLDAGQPQRAAFLASVAQQKGARVDPSLLARIDNALDDSEPLRKDARTLEDEITTATVAFDTSRLSALADAGYGVQEDGSIGDGKPREVASASAASKVAAYAAGQKSFAVGDGSNPS